MFNLLILLALVMAGISIFLVSKLVEQARAEAAAKAKPAEVATKPVLVAKVEITPGTEFVADLVTTKQVPETFLPADAVTKFEDIQGKVAATFLPAGDMIFASKAKQRDQLRRPSLVLGPGKRLITLPIDEARATAYLVKNGDTVDVLAVLILEKFERDIEGDWISRKVSTTILQNVRVFDINFGADTTGEKDGPGRMGRGMNVTFEVTPEQAELVHLLQSVTEQYALSLRRFDDTALVDSRGVLDRDLVKGLMPVAEQPPPPPPEAAPVEAAPAPRRFY
ncbi:MAG: Flp pilus assembly protein CpaB [Candidatus Methylacidiphilales bacterium]